MRAVSRITLKLVATAVILSGNCFVCPLAAHAAAPRAPAAAPHACDEEQPDAPVWPAGVTSSRDIGSPVPVCPLEEQMTAPRTAGDIRNGFTLERPLASAAGLPALHPDAPDGSPKPDIPAASVQPPDKTSFLTGTIVKIE